MKGGLPAAAALALACAVVGGGQASAASPIAGASTASGTKTVLAAVGSLGLPAGLVGAGGVLWLLLRHGKAPRESEAGGGMHRRALGGRKGQLTPHAAIPSSPSASGRRFLVGFSYAGEDRAVVAPVAELLAAKLSKDRVLFDRFQEAELARPDLDVYLPRLYRDQTELIVVVLSPDYPRKRWCGLEWRWIRQLILTAAQERIMLLRIGDPGDLSELGILSGDGYLNISGRSAAATTAAILERLGQREGAAGRPEGPSGLADLDAPSAAATTPRSRWGRTSALLGGGVALLGVGWLVGLPPLARWQLNQGDQAFLAFAKLSDPRQLQRAAVAWQRASELDPRLPDAHARMGFYDDIVGNLAAAERRWRQAAELLPQQTTPQAQEIRNGLASALAQQPGRQLEALGIYDADRFYPRSALEAAMLRWSLPTELPRAHDAVHENELVVSLAGDGPPPRPWGFKSNGELLIFETRAQQRCLLANVRAATNHLAGRNAALAPLDQPDCQGVQFAVQELLCARLGAAGAHPRAAATARWLACPTGTRPNATTSRAP